jgi:hypothetical protein
MSFAPICVFIVIFHNIHASIYVSFYGIGNMEVFFGFVLRLWIIFMEIKIPFWSQLMVLQGAWILMMWELLSIISCHTQLI